MIRRILQTLVNVIAWLALKLGVQLDAPAPWFRPNCEFRTYLH